MFQKLAIALLLFTTATARADSFLEYGLGLNDNGTQTKLISAGYSAPWFLCFDYKLEGGGFIDKNFVAFATGNIGLVVKTSSLYAKVFFGPALITEHDNRLTGAFQFNHDAEIGLQSEGYSIGINYKHLSNAGLMSPNAGRDFLLLKLSIPY